AGIKAGDIIKKVEGVEIYDSPDLQEKVGRLRPGDKVSLSVLKADGSLKNIVVTLKPESKAPAVAARKEVSTGITFDKLGASFAPASDALKAKLGIKDGVV